MIRMFFTVAGPIKLLPHFLEHYTRIGVEQFIFCAYEPSAERYSHILAHVVHHCLQENVLFEKGFCFRKRLMDWKHRALTIAKMVEKRGWLNDWILYPDMDEFVRVPDLHGDLPRYFECLPAKVQVVEGVLRDRITATGKLARVRPGVPLDKQFPWTGDITTGVAERSVGPIKIIVACRGIAPTGHRLRTEAIKRLKQRVKPLVVDHFKWNADCLEHMRKRQRHYEKIDMMNTAQSRRLVAYLAKHGRIRVESPRLHCRPVSRKKE